MSDSKAITPLKQICQGLDAMKDGLEKTLPKGMDVDKFIRTATNAIQMHPQKDKLAECDRQSLFLACQKAAGDGLMLDGREAALVVFKGVAQYMPMTQGLVKLARNSGEISSIEAEVVYAKDKFVFRIGTDALPLHEPDWFGERGEPIGAWAMVKLKNGEVISRILPKDKIMRIANKTMNSYQYDPAKGPYYDEWWRKTAIKNVLKYAPKSTELEMALQREEFEPEIIEAETEAAPKRKTRAAQVVTETVNPPAEIIDVTPTAEETIDIAPLSETVTNEDLPM